MGPKPKRLAAKCCQPFFAAFAYLTGVRHHRGTRHRHGTLALRGSRRAQPQPRGPQPPAHALRSHVRHTTRGPSPDVRTRDDRTIRWPNPTGQAIPGRGTMGLPRQKRHQQTSRAHSTHTARKRKDSSRNSHRHTPVLRPPLRRPGRLQFRRSLAPASTPVEPSTPPATQHISCNAYSPPTPARFFGIRKLPLTMAFYSCPFGLLPLAIVSTYLNAEGGKKFRKSEWLISTIMLKFNHLERTKGMSRDQHFQLGWLSGKATATMRFRRATAMIHQV